MINEVGMDILVDNLDIKGGEELKMRTVQYMQQKAEQPPQPDPLQQAVEVEKEKNQGQMIIEAEKVKVKREENETKAAVQAAEMAIKEQEAHINYLKVLNDLEEKHRRLAIEENAHDSALSNEAIGLAIDVAAQHHDMYMREKEHEHEVNSSQQEMQIAQQQAKQPQG
jgi:hypothetical protein